MVNVLHVEEYHLDIERFLAKRVDYYGSATTSESAHLYSRLQHLKPEVVAVPGSQGLCTSSVSLCSLSVLLLLCMFVCSVYARNSFQQTGCRNHLATSNAMTLGPGYNHQFTHKSSLTFFAGAILSSVTTFVRLGPSEILRLKRYEFYLISWVGELRPWAPRQQSCSNCRRLKSHWDS